jgi:Fic family protein
MTEQGPGNGGNHNLENFKRRAFELCLAVYRVTSLFPKGEVMRGQTRQCSSRIVVLLAAGKIRDTILKAEEIKIYLEIAKNQKWLAPINFDLLQSAYSLLADALPHQGIGSEEMGEKIIATPLPGEKKEKETEFIFDEAEHRQEKIIEYFNKNKEAKVTDLLAILGKISERTIRNDLAVLIDRKLIKKAGNTRNAKYYLNLES